MKTNTSNFWTHCIFLGDICSKFKTCQPFLLLRQLKSEIQVSISWHADLVVAGDLVPRGDRADGADTPGN